MLQSTKAPVPIAMLHSFRGFLNTADAIAISSLFMIGALVYGVFIPSLGFYWDDWPVIWVYNALGSRGVTRYFAGHRPVYGWIYAHLAPILGLSPIGWHVVALIVRCTSCAAVFLIFRALWPMRRDVAWLVGTLVLLYPGFTLQPIALGFIAYYLSFLLFALSLAATILSIRKRQYRWSWCAVALITEIGSYFILEYFIGLELFRLAIIVVLVWRENGPASHKTVKTALGLWSLYGVIWIAYMLWRALIYRTIPSNGPAYMNLGSDLSRVVDSPMGWIAGRVSDSIHNVLMATIVAWSRPFSSDLINFTSSSGMHAWAIAAVVVGITVLSCRKLTTSDRAGEPCATSNDSVRALAESGIGLGLVGLAVAGLPLAISGLTVAFNTQGSFLDRFTLPFMLPASLLLSVLLLMVSSQPLVRTLVIAGTIFAFSAFQVHNGSVFRHDWQSQRSLFWQIAWRAPVLNKGTSVFADDMPRSLYGNHSAGLLNLLYDRDDTSGDLNYFIFDLSQLSENKSSWLGAQASLRLGNQITGRVRSFQFQGTIGKSVVAWISPAGTFRIVTPASASELPRGSSLSRNLSYVSQPSEVIGDARELPNGPLLKILGREPRRQWLYFYQKAELERQLQNWRAVAALGDEVIRKGYKPSDPSEWFPFIEGYARAQRYQTAAELSNTVLQEAPDAVTALSSLWLGINHEDSQNSDELDSALRMLRDKLLLDNRH